MADIEELEMLDASEIHAWTKEITTPKMGDNFIFPIADGTVTLSGGDEGIRKSTQTGSTRKRRRA